MSSPGIRPRNNKPAGVGQAGGKKGSQQALRVLSADGAARAAAPSIVMPRARTELSELLAGDDLLCVRRRSSATATRTNTDRTSGESGADDKLPAESGTAPAAQRNPESPAQTGVGDEDLGRVIDAWPGLPRNVRAGILAMIRETAAGNV